MRTLFITLLLVLTLALTVPAISCPPDEPNCENITNSDVSSWVYTPTWERSVEGPNGDEDFAYNTGFAGHKFDVSATGTESAYAKGFGKSTIQGYGGAFQKEVNGGELSGSGALTVAKSIVMGKAKGVDAPDCDTGADNAKVDLEVHGYVFQQNGSYSDDRQSEIGAWNNSGVEYWGQTDSVDRGTDDQYKKVKVFIGYYKPWKYGKKYPMYRTKIIKISDLTAETSDRLMGMGIAAGGTLVYAKQTKNHAVVKGITASMSTAMLCGAEHQSINVHGAGGISGVANLPKAGYSAFSADYNYAGRNFGAGIAGGQSNVDVTNMSNGVSVTSSATAFSRVVTGGPQRRTD